MCNVGRGESLYGGALVDLLLLGSGLGWAGLGQGGGLFLPDEKLERFDRDDDVSL